MVPRLPPLRATLASEGPSLILQAHRLVEMVLAKHGSGTPQQIRVRPTPLPACQLTYQGGEGIAALLPAGDRHE